MKKQVKPTYNTNNINHYYHDRFDQSFNNVNITFMTTLRGPIEVGDLNKTVHHIPSCYGRMTASAEKKHTSKDLVKVSNIGQHEHLIRNRIGIKPLLGSVIFETTLRNQKMRSISNQQDAKTQRTQAKQRQNTELPKIPKEPFLEITEKNMNQFSHCLKEENQGTIKPSLIEWIVSLKNKQKKKKKQ